MEWGKEAPLPLIRNAARSVPPAHQGVELPSMSSSQGTNTHLVHSGRSMRNRMKKKMGTWRQKRASLLAHEQMEHAKVNVCFTAMTNGDAAGVRRCLAWRRSRVRHCAIVVQL